MTLIDILKYADITKEEIINNSKNLQPPKIGIYFLIRNNSIVYIGQTKNLKTRLENHSRHNGVGFNSYYFLPVNLHKINEKDLDIVLSDLEAYFIVKFAPHENWQLPNNNKYKCRGALLQQFNCPGKIFDSYVKKIT